MRAVDAVVVGGGVIGCASAYALAREGASVALVERDGVGRHASGAAAGMLAPLIETLGEGPLAALGLESLELLPDLAAEVRELSGIDPQYTASGILRAALPAETPALRASAAALAAHGCAWLEPDELGKREPRLGAGFSGALWSPREGHVHPLLLTRALAQAALRRGARLERGRNVVGLVREGERVTGVLTDAGPLAAAEVVLCTGAWTSATQAWVDAPLPVEPVKGQMLELAAPEPTLRTIVWGPGAYLVPRADGSLWVGATVERVGFDVRPTAGGIAALLEAARGLLPVLSDCAFRRAWAGLRPGTRDGLPLVGPVPGARGLYAAAGHYRSGILLAALTARAVADWVLRGERHGSLAPLDPARFAEP